MAGMHLHTITLTDCCREEQLYVAFLLAVSILYISMQWKKWGQPFFQSAA